MSIFVAIFGFKFLAGHFWDIFMGWAGCFGLLEWLVWF
jgi:hypothetical protein